jgi:hypothetical protein
MAIVSPTAPGVMAATAGPSESMLILIAVTIVTAAAAYFTGRLYGKVGLMSIAAGYAVIVGVLTLLGGVRFG